MYPGPKTITRGGARGKTKEGEGGGQMKVKLGSRTSFLSNIYYYNG
jgi:hypothetical protein